MFATRPGPLGLGIQMLCESWICQRRYAKLSTGAEGAVTSDLRGLSAQGLRKFTGLEGSQGFERNNSKHGGHRDTLQVSKYRSGGKSRSGISNLG